MKKTMKHGRVYWTADYDEIDEVHERIAPLIGDNCLHDGEHGFVAQMVKMAEGSFFEVSDKQMTWLDAILYRSGRKPLVGAGT